MNITHSAHGQKNLTGGVATDVLAISLFDGQSIGGSITALTHASDGTDFQSVTDHFVFTANRTVGTVAVNDGNIDAQIQAAPSSIAGGSAGLLTTTWTIAVSGNNVVIRCNAVSSLTETTLKTHWHLVLHGTIDEITIA